MEQHQILYKGTSMLGVGAHNKINRGRQNESRANERKRIFLSRRNIEEQEDEKENETAVDDNPLANSTQVEQKVAAESKLSHQEKYLQRLIKWKVSKELISARKPLKRPPFLPAGANTAVTRAKNAPEISSAAPSFAPRSHAFTAPSGLRNPAVTKEPTTIHKSLTNAKLRQSFYTVVPTPPRKNLIEELKRKTAFSAVARSAYTPVQSMRAKAPQSTTTSTKPATKTIPTSGGERNLFSVQQNSRKTPTAAPKSNAKPMTITTARKTSTKTTTKTQTAQAVFTKPLPFKLPATSPPRPARNVERPGATARIVKPIRGAGGGLVVDNKAPHAHGAIGKAKQQMRQKRPNNATAAKLAVSMKAKKPSYAPTAAAIKRAAPPVAFKLNGKMLLEVGAESTLQSVAETPTDFANLNPFDAFVTSTKLRASGHSTSTKLSDICDGISPVEALHGGAQKELSSPKRSSGHASSAAKRALIQGQIEVRKGDVDKSKKKFNFLRQDVSVWVTEEMGVQVEVMPCVKTTLEVEAVTMAQKVDDTDEDRTLQKTPSKEDNADRPANYLSPFVSVSRGKVNLCKEREKRNSIYLQQPPTPTETSEKPLLPPATEPITPVEVRRTLETVRYFRQQLSDEIARMQVLCDQWDAYKAEHLTRLQETGGEDMINVTVGQTRLLTSKKFMQFSSLIDRCEAGVCGTGVANDGREETKPITVVDLEGFWCMIGLQVDNVDKRFENLTRWKANDWLDPETLDEVVPPANKPKKNLSKVKKAKTATSANGAVAIIAKTKSRSGLQQMLRKMRINHAKSAAAVTAKDEAKAKTEDPFAATTPNLKRRSQSGTPRSSTPRRISVIVRDRKSRSAAATIISIPSPTTSVTSRRDSFVRYDSPTMPVCGRLRQHVMARRPQNLQKSAVIGAANERRQSVSSTPPRTPMASGRKSILKTPGTANGNRKSVNFDKKVHIKKFKFIEGSEQSEEDD